MNEQEEIRHLRNVLPQMTDTGIAQVIEYRISELKRQIEEKKRGGTNGSSSGLPSV